MPILVVGNTEVPYELRYSAKAKHLRIQVRPERVEVVAPLKARKSVIEAFLREKRHWIVEKKNELEEKLRNRPQPQPLSLATGAKIPFRGSHTGLTIRESNSQTQQVSYTSDLLVTIPGGMDSAKKETAVKTMLKGWFIEQMSSDVDEISDLFSRILQVRPSKIRLRQQKTRWGSCSAKGSINLNWQLIFVPRPMLEYVVVHELCHLKHLNHSQEFWTLLGSLLPDYRTRKKWLREYRPAFPAGFWD